MPDEQDLRARVHARDSSLRRLKTLTGAVAVAVTALTGIFAGLAAHTAAGRKLVRVTVQSKVARAAARQRPAVPPPPALPESGSDSAPAPAAPAQPPAAAAAPAPPVVVSGGS
jgi:hypothetical protein